MTSLMNNPLYMFVCVWWARGWSAAAVLVGNLLRQNGVQCCVPWVAYSALLKISVNSVRLHVVAKNPYWFIPFRSSILPSRGGPHGLVRSIDQYVVNYLQEFSNTLYWDVSLFVSRIFHVHQFRRHDSPPPTLRTTINFVILCLGLWFRLVRIPTSYRGHTDAFLWRL